MDWQNLDKKMNSLRQYMDVGDYAKARPLYEQIKESIRKMVISNAFLADEKLPSVREMASQLAVNPNAIERAYQELEQDGYVYRRKDEGTFVAKENRVNEMRRRELMQKFDLVVRELSELSVSSNELAERVEVITKGDKTF